MKIGEIVTDHKTCKKCLNTRLAIEFYKSNYGNPLSECLHCYRERYRERYRNKIRATGREVKVQGAKHEPA